MQKTRAIERGTKGETAPGPQGLGQREFITPYALRSGDFVQQTNSIFLKIISRSLHFQRASSSSLAAGPLKSVGGSAENRWKH